MSSTLSHGPFRGRFEIKLDPKGRVSLPAAFRQVLPGQNPELIITNSRYQRRNCLHVYSLAEWEKLERRISKMSSLKTEVQAFSRFYLSGGQNADVDAQNRILIPQGLRKFASLDSQIVLVGMGAKFEIWSADIWSSIYEQLTDSFEDTMAAVAALEDGTDGELE